MMMMMTGVITFSGCWWVCESVQMYICPCFPNVVNDIFEKYWTYFNQTFSICAYWAKMRQCWKFSENIFAIRIKHRVLDIKVKVQVYVGVSHARKCTYTISWKWLDWTSPNFQHWRILGQRWMIQFSASKGQRSGQGHSMTKGPAVGGIRSSTLYIKF